MKTAKYKKALSALIEGKAHRRPCLCPSCLFDLYSRSPKSRKGYPYSKRLFFWNFLFHEAILGALEKEKKTETIFLYGKKRRVIPIKYRKDLDTYERTSAYLEVHEILKKLLQTETRKEHFRFLRGLVRFKTYYEREKAEGFRNLISELIKGRLFNIQSGIPRSLSAIS